MPAAAAAAAAAAAPEPAVAEAAPLRDEDDGLDEPPEPNNRRGSSRNGLMKPFVVLALPGMYLFYKYNQYRREQREASRRRVTERELQHLHHKIDKLLNKLEENEPEMASSQEDEQGPPRGPPPGPPPTAKSVEPEQYQFEQQGFVAQDHNIVVGGTDTAGTAAAPGVYHCERVAAAQG